MTWDRVIAAYFPHYQVVLLVAVSYQFLCLSGLHCVQPPRLVPVSYSYDVPSLGYRHSPLSSFPAAQEITGCGISTIRLHSIGDRATPLRRRPAQ